MSVHASHRSSSRRRSADVIRRDADESVSDGVGGGRQDTCRRGCGVCVHVHGSRVFLLVHRCRHQRGPISTSLLFRRVQTDDAENGRRFSRLLVGAVRHHGVVDDATLRHLVGLDVCRLFSRRFGRHVGGIRRNDRQTETPHDGNVDATEIRHGVRADGVRGKSTSRRPYDVNNHGGVCGDEFCSRFVDLLRPDGRCDVTNVVRGDVFHVARQQRHQSDHLLFAHAYDEETGSEVGAKWLGVWELYGRGGGSS